MSNRSDIARLTLEYFVNNNEKALYELLDIITKIYHSRLRKYNIKLDIIEDGVQNLHLGVIKHTKTFDISKNDNFIAYLDSFIHGEVYRTVMSVIYPFINRDNKNLLSATKYISADIPHEVAASKNAKISKDIYKDAKAIVGYSHIDIYDENDEPLNLVCDQPRVDEIIDQQKIYNHLMLLISNLSEEDRYIITEIYLKGRTLAQLGNEYNITPQAIDCRIRRILRNLKKDMIDFGNFDSPPIINTDLLELK